MFPGSYSAGEQLGDRKPKGPPILKVSKLVLQTSAIRVFEDTAEMCSSAVDPSQTVHNSEKLGAPP